MNKKFVSGVLAASLALSTFFSATAFAGSTYPQGDVNKSGKVETADARLALRTSVKLETLDEEAFALADVDFNGKVESADARLILRAAVGLEVLEEPAEPHEHSFGEWAPEKDKDGAVTDNHIRECECGETETEAHDFELVYASQFTCTQTGYGYYQCKGCGYRKAPFATTGSHDWQIIENVPETCTEDGHIRSVCSICSKEQTEILAKKHIPGEEATCTTDQLCTRCHEVLAPALGHKLPATVSIGVTKGVTCGRCGEEAIPSFNTLVNELKKTTHYYSTFDKTVSDFKDPKFTGLMALMKSMFEAEFKDQIGVTTEYSMFTSKRRITKDNFHLSGSENVSELEDKNIKSIKTEKVSGVDFLKTLPDSYTYGSRTFDLTGYKNTVLGDLLKVTVTLKQEKYSECEKLGGSDGIDKIFSNYGATLTETFKGLSDADFEGFMKNEGDCISDATVVYYFDAQTFAPVASYYLVKMNMDQMMNMYITDSGEASADPTGSIKFNIITDMYSYYFFDNYFAN